MNERERGELAVRAVLSSFATVRRPTEIELTFADVVARRVEDLVGRMLWFVRARPSSNLDHEGLIVKLSHRRPWSWRDVVGELRLVLRHVGQVTRSRLR